jgi:hypothetical protein
LVLVSLPNAAMVMRLPTNFVKVRG